MDKIIAEYSKPLTGRKARANQAKEDAKEAAEEEGGDEDFEEDEEEGWPEVPFQPLLDPISTPYQPHFNPISTPFQHG